MQEGMKMKNYKMPYVEIVDITVCDVIKTSDIPDPRPDPTPGTKPDTITTEWFSI